MRWDLSNTTRPGPAHIAPCIFAPPLLARRAPLLLARRVRARIQRNPGRGTTAHSAGSCILDGSTFSCGPALLLRNVDINGGLPESHLAANANEGKLSGFVEPSDGVFGHTKATSNFNGG